MNNESSVTNQQQKYDLAILAYVRDNELIDEANKPLLQSAFVYFLEIKLNRRPRFKPQEADIFEMDGMSKSVFIGLMRVLDFDDQQIDAIWNDSN